MGPIWLLIGLALGAAIALVALRRTHTSRVSELTARLTETERQRVIAETRCGELKQESLRSAGVSNAEVARLETELEGERRLATEKLAALTEVREELLARVGRSAGEVLDGRGKQLIEQLKAELSAVKTEATADMGKRQQAVEDLVKPLQETMKQMGEAMDKVDIDRRRTHTELKEGLVAVTEAQKELRTETGILGRALRQPQTRGRWGEMHLRRLVEAAGMSPLCDFTEQTHIDDEGKFLRPDMVVHLPGEKDIVVDSKAPLAPYLDACDATDETARGAHMKMYARGVRAHVKKLASKDYARQFDSAPDFVLMYLPGEHFFSAAVETDPALIEDALHDCVLIATPTTLLVMLKTVAHSWQQEKVAEEAQAIASLGQQMYDRLITYLNHVDRVSKCMNTLIKAQNESVGSLERMVLPTARQFPNLGAVAANKGLPSPRQVNQAAREVQARELDASEGEATEVERGDVRGELHDEGNTQEAA